jgi:hypothetical protein
MLFSLRLIVLFSSTTAASVLVVFGTAAVPVPSDPAEPVVTPRASFAPEDRAVPALLVPRPADESALCARVMAGEIRIAPTTIAAIADVRIIGISLLELNCGPSGLFRELSAAPAIEGHGNRARIMPRA